MPRNNLVSLIDRILLIFSPLFTHRRSLDSSTLQVNRSFPFLLARRFRFNVSPPRSQQKWNSYTIEICIQRGAWRGTAEKQDNRDTFLTECITRADLSRWFIFMLLSGRKLEGERKGRRFVRSQVIKKSSLVLCLNFSGGRGYTRRKGRKSRNRDKICRQFPFLI